MHSCSFSTTMIAMSYVIAMNLCVTCEPNWFVKYVISIKNVQECFCNVKECRSCLLWVQANFSATFDNYWFDGNGSKIDYKIWQRLTTKVCKNIKYWIWFLLVLFITILFIFYLSYIIINNNKYINKFYVFLFKAFLKDISPNFTW